MIHFAHSFWPLNVNSSFRKIKVNNLNGEQSAFILSSLAIPTLKVIFEAKVYSRCTSARNERDYVEGGLS